MLHERFMRAVSVVWAVVCVAGLAITVAHEDLVGSLIEIACVVMNVNMFHFWDRQIQRKASPP